MLYFEVRMGVDVGLVQTRFASKRQRPPIPGRVSGMGVHVHNASFARIMSSRSRFPFPYSALFVACTAPHPQAHHQTSTAPSARPIRCGFSAAR